MSTPLETDYDPEALGQVKIKTQKQNFITKLMKTIQTKQEKPQITIQFQTIQLDDESFNYERLHSMYKQICSYAMTVISFMLLLLHTQISSFFDDLDISSRFFLLFALLLIVLISFLCFCFVFPCFLFPLFVLGFT